VKSFVDTNILVYAVDRAEPAKSRIAATLLEERADALVLSAQVLSEFYTVSTRLLATPLTTVAAASFVDDLGRLPIVAIDLDLVRDGIRLSGSATPSMMPTAMPNCRRIRA